MYVLKSISTNYAHCAKNPLHSLFYLMFISYEFSWKACHRKYKGTCKKFDEVVEALGLENITKLVER